jgi:hypothetical protein
MMNKVTFFWNDRQDGAVHRGLSANDVLLFDELTEGGAEPDPALNWYVDIDCTSRSISKIPHEIREWFLRLSPHINACFDALLQKLEVGADGGLYPFFQRKSVKAHPSVINIEIKGSAMQKIRAADIARRLSKVRNSWETELRQLPESDYVQA